ncbi:FimV/HubP family polar landmark protein, partial [Candidatus Albibeggiatoa sp. nov. NOAA]|uniref:type IV pilus assembly protein FimV n=1 Tax=Candidatus Albibeggiatoa sp. nov. NOAA TaxID=3162724 RepID=UPI003300E994|nr:hypothetical protein [Thiotrichaceae bacterium]
MIRKLIVAWVALITALCGLEVAALGLSNIDVVSKLNEPLNAKVKILSIPRGDINNLKVSLAPVEAFRRAGLEFPIVLNALEFKIQPLNDRGSQAILSITTRQPLKEPFLNFLVEVNWPSGRIRREYTALLDPPLHEKKVAEVIKYATTQNVNALSQRQPVSNTQKYQPLNTRASSEPTTYTISRGDTLSKIARKTHVDKSISFNQHMKNLYRNNPHAFIRNNMHLIRSGAVLRIPAPSNTTSAQNTAIAQYTPPSQPNRVAAATQESAAYNGNRLNTLAAPAQPRVRIASVSKPQDNPDRAGNVRSPQTRATSSELRALRTQLENLNEENLSIREENKNLKSRLDETSDLVKTMKAQLDELNYLIKLQSGELAKLQRQLKDTGVMAEEAEAIKPIEELKEQAKQEVGTKESPDVNTIAPIQIAKTDENTEGFMDSKPSTVSTMSATGDNAGTPNETGTDSNEQVNTDDIEVIGEDPNGESTTDETVIVENGIDGTGSNITSGETEKLTPENDTNKGTDTTVEEPPLLDGETELSEPEEPTIEDIKPLTTWEIIDNMTGGTLGTANELVEPVPGGWMTVGGGLGGLLLLIILLMILLGKRRKAKQAQEEEEIQAELERLEAEEKAELSDSDFDLDADSKDSRTDEEDDLDDLMNKIKQENQDSDDLDSEVLEEVDVYLAYENYDQAIELLNYEIEKHPDQTEYRVKMLEVLALANKPQEFETHAKALKTQVNAQGPHWDKAISLWNDMNTGRELLADDKESSGGNTAALAAGAAALGVGAGVAAATMLSDDDSSSSDDEDIANLLAQVDSETKDDNDLDMDGLSGGESLDINSLDTGDDEEDLAASLHGDSSGGLDMSDALAELGDDDDDSGLESLDADNELEMDGGLDLGDELDAGDDLDLGDELDVGDDLDLGDELDAGDDLDLGDELDAGDDLDLGDELDVGDDLDLGD